MANKVTEKYFSHKNFAPREQEVLKRVLQQTGFVIEKEIYRGIIFDPEKVGSLIYQGSYQSKPAVLKLQGLQPEVSEAVMLSEFTKQNQSAIIRVPNLYFHEPWKAEQEYEVLITEFVDGKKIFTMPFASSAQMREFTQLYQEYRTKALTKPWLEKGPEDAATFILHRAEKWREICLSKGRLAPSDFEPYYQRFVEVIPQLTSGLPMIFSHGHFSADDIYKVSDHDYVLFSNLFWSYRPQWYDLAFNLWACFQKIREPEYNFEKLLVYLAQWLEQYETIPVTTTDPLFRKHLLTMMLERTMGTMLAEIGSHAMFDDPNLKPVYSMLIGLHQQLFNWLLIQLQLPPL